MGGWVYFGGLVVRWWVFEKSGLVGFGPEKVPAHPSGGVFLGFSQFVCKGQKLTMLLYTPPFV